MDDESIGWESHHQWVRYLTSVPAAQAMPWQAAGGTQGPGMQLAIVSCGHTGFGALEQQENYTPRAKNTKLRVLRKQVK